MAKENKKQRKKTKQAKHNIKAKKKQNNKMLSKQDKEK